MTAATIERRFVSTPIELRGTKVKPRIVGHAARFSVLSEDLGGFRERIAPGAFDYALGGTPDVRALLNHDPNQIIARTKNGSLRLYADTQGLRVEIRPAADTQTVRDVLANIKAGNLDQMSFAFRVDDDLIDHSGDTPVRTIKRMRELIDVSIVTFPAYPQTTAQVRSLCATNVALDRIRQAKIRSRADRAMERSRRVARAMHG